MVEDLLLPVQVIGTDTRREPNGLAMSSRNAYLLESEKQIAAILLRTEKGSKSGARQYPDKNNTQATKAAINQCWICTRLS